MTSGQPRIARRSVVNLRRCLPLCFPLCLVFGLGGCEEEEEIKWHRASDYADSSGKPKAKTPDRLPPGELLEGPDEVFGFAVPKGMEMSRRGKRVARIVGNVNFDQLTDYVKDRIAARHAEMLEDTLVFPSARIRGDADHIYELSIRQDGRRVVLEIRDKTKLPPTHGLTEQQRWERAGMKPSGGLIDPNAME